MNIIFYHGSDFDGKASGQIMGRFLPDNTTWGMSHKDPFPSWFNPTMEDTVWFVDISTNPPERMKELCEKTNVMVLDHHKSFIKWARENIPDDIIAKWVLDTSKAACQLCWEYFNKDKPMPKAIQYMAQYDIWDRSNIEYWNTVLMPFQEGIKGIRSDDPVWDLFFSDSDVVDSYIKKGTPLVEYMIASNESLMKKHAFPAIFKHKGKEYRALCCNTHNFSSLTFEYLWDEKQYDVMIAYCCSKGTEYWVSLYTTNKIDFSRIAFVYGGGGHPQACGFNAKKVKLYKRFGKQYIKFKV